MKRIFLVATLLTAAFAGAQVEKVIIPAGSPEDQAMQAISGENDVQKRIAMLQDFLQKFSGNRQAVTYGEWQLAEAYLDQGDTAKALEYGKKAADSQPNNLDILMFLAGAAHRAKANDVIVDCAVRGGAAFNGIAVQPKPDGMSDEAYQLRIKQAQDPARSSFEYLETSGLNAMVDESDAKKRMTYIERYMAAFPGSRFQEQITQLALQTLGQLNDSARLASFSQKALAANPNSVSTLVVLSEAYGASAEPASGTRAETYARKALELAAAQKPTAENRMALFSGLAHSALGYALLKQDKNVPAIAELKAATAQLKEQADAYPAALYRLGFAYAKTGRLTEAKTALTELAAIDGPYRQPARDLLAKVEAGARAPARKK
jgi:tetratricopeptide (TPR) repeat protein